METYSQVVELEIDKKARLKQVGCIVCFVFALVFLIVALTKHLAFLAPFAFFLIASFVLIKMFNTTPKEYKYSLNTASFVIFKKNVIGETKKIALINLEDIKEFKLFDTMVEDKDIVCCINPTNQGVYELVANINGENTKFLLEPDLYMINMINELIK